MQEVEAECRRVPLNGGHLANMNLLRFSCLNPTQHKCIITYFVHVGLGKIHTRNTELHYSMVSKGINTRAYVNASTHAIIMAKVNTNYMENADIQ